VLSREYSVSMPSRSFTRFGRILGTGFGFFMVTV
jgi:hypothetical protein